MRRRVPTPLLNPRPHGPFPEDLNHLMQALLDGVHRSEPKAREGAVRGRRPGSYRRIDCDGRALAYLRPRAQRGARGVRIDLSGLWVRPRSSPLDIPGRSGSASLFVFGPKDLPEAVRFLVEALRLTRRLMAEEAERPSRAPARPRDDSWARGA